MSQACQEEWDVTFFFKMLSLVKAVCTSIQCGKCYNINSMGVMEQGEWTKFKFNKEERLCTEEGIVGKRKALMIHPRADLSHNP